MPNAAKVYDPTGRNGKRAPDRRPSAAQRGYTSKWAKTATAFLAEPGNDVCHYCRDEGRRTPSTCVDHVVPVEGPYDPNFWRRSNWKACCNSHNAKRAWQLVRKGMAK